MRWFGYPNNPCEALLRDPCEVFIDFSFIYEVCILCLEVWDFDKSAVWGFHHTTNWYLNLCSLEKKSGLFDKSALGICFMCFWDCLVPGCAYGICFIVCISELKQLYCVHYDTYTSKFVVYYFYACLLYWNTISVNFIILDLGIKSDVQ
jgi:hypothetical protein